LTLVEHALCPLDGQTSLQANLVHQCEYYFTDSARHQRKASARVDCPRGLSASDEFFLWGLLALALSQPEPTFDYYATPHYCLTRLGCISPGSKGGKSYALFRQAIARLSAVLYQNDRFFDPIRREHRAVSFGFFSYSLPLDPDSSRAWRIVWDPLFFEFCQATGGQLVFDLETYRRMDCASRRMFLLLRKVFWRQKSSPAFEVRHLAVNVLGFSAGLSTRTLKAKVKRCVGTLLTESIVALPHGAAGVDDLFEKRAKGEHFLRLERGEYFQRQSGLAKQRDAEASPLFDPLRAIGFDPTTIARILQRFKPAVIQVWADVTLAALERKGRAFFQRSPEAFFMDNVQQASQGRRTPPDWFLELQKTEQRREAEEGRRARNERHNNGHERGSMMPPAKLRERFEELVQEMFSQFRAAGQPEQDAHRNAQRFAAEHLRRKESADAFISRPLAAVRQSDRS
jgi:hypothetical protein